MLHVIEGPSFHRLQRKPPNLRNRLPRRLKPQDSREVSAARLKSCPDTSCISEASFSAAWMVVP